jgi:DNA-binding transcriptional ArsR family regulator
MTRDAVWSALSHPVRRRIVDRLRDGPAATGDLTALAGKEPGARFAVQRHLTVLREAGLVTTEKTGRERRNFLDGSALFEATIGWLDPPSRRAATGLHALKTLTENQENVMSNNGFQQISVRQRIETAAAPTTVWAALVGDVSSWWGSPYLLIEGPGTRIVVDPVIGAPVVETCGAEHRTWGTVSAVKPGEILGWTGAMGMGALAWGTVEFTLTAAGDGTVVELAHDAFGGFGDGGKASYTHGWNDLLHRLRAHVDHGADHGVAGLNRPVSDATAPQ